MKTLSTSATEQFSARLLIWYRQYGRHDLPWQGKDAYSVWLSEIMLQQTQVVTVIAYYERFLARFPTLESLATASLDDVLALWSGLGYYARARNMHKAAGILYNEYASKFPVHLTQMQSLPGIGRSTAAAILTFAMQQSHAILDGNVKRVLARHYEIQGWTGSSSTLKQLWALSEQLTPQENTSQYNQAMMDLGATVCTRSKPKCIQCCFNETCLAYKNESWAVYPNARPKKKKPLKEAFLVLLKYGDTVFLEKRIAHGIWGGLWSFPEFATEESADEWLSGQVAHFEQTHKKVYLKAVLHRFSHYDFLIHLIVYDAKALIYQINDSNSVYFSVHKAQTTGLPAPIKKILKKYI